MQKAALNHLKSQDLLNGNRKDKQAKSYISRTIRPPSKRLKPKRLFVPSKYIEFKSWDEDIDFDSKMKELQAEIKKLLNLFKELGYE